MNGQRMPRFMLPHINDEQVSLTDYRGRSLVVLFGGRNTAEQVNQIVAAIHTARPPSELPIVQIATLKGVPRVAQSLAKRDIKSGYDKQAGLEAARLKASGKPIPDDMSHLVVILLDWEGELVTELDIRELETEAVAYIVDGTGRIVDRCSGMGIVERVDQLLPAQR